MKGLASTVGDFADDDRSEVGQGVFQTGQYRLFKAFNVDLDQQDRFNVVFSKIVIPVGNLEFSDGDIAFFFGGS